MCAAWFNCEPINRSPIGICADLACIMAVNDLISFSPNVNVHYFHQQSLPPSWFLNQRERERGVKYIYVKFVSFFRSSSTGVLFSLAWRKFYFDPTFSCTSYYQWFASTWKVNIWSGRDHLSTCWSKMYFSVKQLCLLLGGGKLLPTLQDVLKSKGS